MLKNNLNKIIGVSIIFAIGTLAGFGILIAVLNYFAFSQIIAIQIDPINTVSIIINVLLVLYVTRILSRKNEEERVEKDILITRLGRFQDVLDAAVAGFLATENLKLVVVTSELKTLRQDFNSIFALLNKYDFVTTDDNLCTEINTRIRDIKDFLTDTPRAGEADDRDIEINHDEISMGTQNRQRIEESNTAIKDKIFDLVVLINRKK